MSDDPANAPKTSEPDAPARPAPGPLAWLPWLAAIGFALLAGFLGQAYFAARSEMALSRDQAALAEIEKQGFQQQLEAERILSAHRTAHPASEADAMGRLRIVPLLAPSGASASIRAVVVWDAAAHQGELAAFGLPALPAGERYRVCIIDPKYPEPVCAATFTAQPQGGQSRVHLLPARPIANAAKFVVSSGRADGEPRPSDPVVLSGE